MTALVTRPTDPLPTLLSEIKSAVINEGFTELYNFLENKNIVSGNVDTTSADGIVDKNSTQTITGDKTFSGTLAISGTFSLAGVELIIDADLDSSLRSATDDEVILKLGNVDEYTFTGTHINMGTNQIRFDNDVNAIQQKDVGGTYRTAVKATSGDDLGLGFGNFDVELDGTTHVRVEVAGVERARVTNSAMEVGVNIEAGAQIQFENNIAAIRQKDATATLRTVAMVNSSNDLLFGAGDLNTELNAGGHLRFDINSVEQARFTTTGLELSSDIRLDANRIYFDASDAYYLNINGTVIQYVGDGLQKIAIDAGGGQQTQLRVQSEDGHDAEVAFSDTTAIRYVAGYDDSNDSFTIQRGTTFTTNTTNWMMDSNARIISRMNSVAATNPGYTIQAANSGSTILGLELHNDGVAAINSAARIGFNAETTTNGETPMVYIDGVATDISASGYDGQVRYMIAADGAAPAAKFYMRSGGTGSGPMFGIKAPSAGPYAFAITNDTYSTAISDGFMAWVTNAGATTLRAYNTTSGTYLPIVQQVSSLTVEGKEGLDSVLRVQSGVANCDINLEGSTTSSGSHVGIRANGDQLRLIADGQGVATFDASVFNWTPTSGEGIYANWDATATTVTINGQEEYGGTPVLSIESRQTNHGSFIFGGKGLTGGTGRLLDMVDADDSNGRYGTLRQYLDGTIQTTLSPVAVGLRLESYDNGTDTGRNIFIGRNTNATTPAAGYITFYDKSGTPYYVWVSDAGDLRINTVTPTFANDAAGVVVGTQT
jgi:hypothetical protein